MKQRKSVWILAAGLFLLSANFVFGQEESAVIELLRTGDQYSGVQIQLRQTDEQQGLVVQFRGTDDLHYYAKSETAPAPGLELKISAESEKVKFGQAEFPDFTYFTDSAGDRIEVYVGDFDVFLPITSGDTSGAFQAQVLIKGIACTSQLCLPPFSRTIPVDVNFSESRVTMFLPTEPAAASGPTASAAEPQLSEVKLSQTNPLRDTLAGWKEEVAGEGAEDRGVIFYFVLAVLAGISINIMPCVLPVIPLIVMRLVSQAKESGPRRVALGLSFCGGIILFFVVFALVSAVITLTTGSVVDLNSLYRHPPAVIVLFLLIVFFSLVFLDIVTIALPSSVAGKQGGGSGFAGSVGMGFFAGLLSTPCSGALLGAVLVWAQTQPLVVSSAAMILMGVGMALPYAVLIAVPKLMDYIPKPGTWMEIFKKTGGFLLLLIAVKFTLTALPKDRLINVLLYGVIFSFCIWMWGQWVGYNTPAGRKWTVRLIAIILVLAAGFWLLPAPPESEVDWQVYDASVINEAIEKGQPVLIKFTADWCTNCKVVESTVYHLPDIAQLIEDRGFLPVKADTTQAGFPAAIDLNSIFGEAGNVPVTVFLDPKTKSLLKLRGIFLPEEFTQAVQEMK